MLLFKRAVFVKWVGDYVGSDKFVSIPRMMSEVCQFNEAKQNL